MKENWDLIIKPHKSLLEIDVKELWDYRDLLLMFVKRDIVTVYKQTVLGPLWFVVQPVLTMLMFMVVFGNIAKIEISDQGVPPALFYLAGIIIWTYFSDCFVQTSDTFTKNAEIFGKVYFPRLIMPMSKVVSGLVKFFIQLVLFLLVYFYFLFGTEQNIVFEWGYSWLLPCLILLMAGLGLGFGLIFSALTTKYRDLKFLLQFGVQLLMYATPVIYPVSKIGTGTLGQIMFYNPLAHIVEAFKKIFLGEGALTAEGLIYSTVFTIVVLIMGVLIFNKTERNFVDTV